MANYNQVSYGSQGSDVRTLQELLNQNGYNLSVDGIFGEKTKAAVTDYQTKKGLAVDGIVGKNTWGALTAAQTPAPQEPAQTTTPAAPQPEAPKFDYQPSDTIARAEALLQQQLANKPGEYQSQWQAQLDEVLNKILNREKFSYDLNGDMLYQQYKDQYTTQGKLAMMDTIGQAAAMTGGYGNSYGQTAGQQAYQGYLQQLNDKVPELYALALDKYNQEGQAMYDQASLMAQMEDQDYGRYRDKLSDYYTDLNYLTENARYMSETEYNRALQDFNIKYSSYWDQTNFDYQTERDQIADQQWQATFDEGVRQYNEQFEYQKSQDSISNDLAYRKLQQDEEDAAAKEQQEWEEAVKAAADSDDVKSFMAKMDKDTQHWDAVMRHMYGSEKTYIAQQLENSNLTEAEQAYLISHYGITELDTQYKKSHS